MNYNKKYVFILILVTCYRNVSAQEKIELPPVSDSWQALIIGVNFSPDICYRTLTNNDGDTLTNSLIDARNENETPKFGYTTGFNVWVHIKYLPLIETGIQYSNKGYQIPTYDLVWSQPDPTLPVRAKYIYGFHYIDIPLKAKFSFGKKRVHFFATAGITTNIFLKETFTGVLEYPDGKKERGTSTIKYYNYRRINFSPTVSIGIGYEINNRTIIKVEPTFRYSILKIIDAPITGYLWNGGINFSYWYGFRLK